MVTRVVGRGICPKCGREGSVVLKSVGGRVYIYFKHGRKWCYVGPLENHDLSKLITDLRDYHSLTTKFTSFLTHLGGNLRVATLFIINTSLIVLTYGINLGGVKYSPVVTSLVLLTSVVTCSLLATYEGTSMSVTTYATLRKLINYGLTPYLLITYLASVATLIATLPLQSPINYLITIKLGWGYSVIKIPLNALVLNALVLTYLSRPLSTVRKLVLATAVPIATTATLVAVPILVNAYVVTNTTYLIASVITASLITTALVITFNTLVAIIKTLS